LGVWFRGPFRKAFITVAVPAAIVRSVDPISDTLAAWYGTVFQQLTDLIQTEPTLAKWVVVPSQPHGVFLQVLADCLVG
jgi:hypothetical protein